MKEWEEELFCERVGERVVLWKSKRNNCFVKEWEKELSCGKVREIIVL